MIGEMHPQVREAVGVEAPGERVHERDRVKSWSKKVRAARSDDSMQYKRIKWWRSYLAGFRPQTHDTGAGETASPLWGDPEEYADLTGKRVLTNFILAMLNAAVPRIYARNPEVMVRPAPSVDESRYELTKNFARTCEIVLKHAFTRAKLKKAMKKATRVAMAAGYAVLKVGFYRDYATDTILKDRTPAVDEAILRLKALVEEWRSENLTEDRRPELELEIESLQASLLMEVRELRSEGIAIDNLDPLDFVVPSSVRDLQDYEQAPWLGMGDWMTLDEARERFGLTEEEAEQIGDRETRSETTGWREGVWDWWDGEEGQKGMIEGEDGRKLSAEGKQAYVRVWEIWHKRDMTVYTFIEGLDRFARKPYQPESQPGRWYPFFLVIFNPIDHRRHPKSDVELLRENQDVTEFTRRQFYLHRKRSPQRFMVDGGRMSPTDAQKVADAEVCEMITVNTEAGDHKIAENLALQNLVAAVPVTPPDPGTYDIAPTRSDMEQTAGLGDAQSGTVRDPKTATEARQLGAALSDRAEDRTSNLEDVVGEIGAAVLETLLMELPPERVMQIAGPSAVWIQYQREHITAVDRMTLYDLVSIEVKGGSAGKPNDDLSREQWLQFIPLLLQLEEKVMMFRMMGNEEAAQATIEILKETLSRFDERMDVEKFLPGGLLLPGVPPPQALQEAAARGIPIPIPESPLAAAAGAGPDGPEGPSGPGMGGMMPGAIGPGAPEAGSPGRPGQMGAPPEVPGGPGQRREA